MSDGKWGRRRLELSLFSGLAILVSGACAPESPQGTPTFVGSSPVPGAAMPSSSSAAFSLSAQILGPASQDDDADLRIVLIETAGGNATLNFVRLTCTDGTEREWGAGGFVNEFGTNLIRGFEERVFVRHYFCPTSSRPVELLAYLTAESGEELRVFATPLHPDWSFRSS